MLGFGTGAPADEQDNCRYRSAEPANPPRVVADHAVTLLPSALAFGLVGGGAVLGHAAGHAHAPAVAAEEFPVRVGQTVAVYAGKRVLRGPSVLVERELQARLGGEWRMVVPKGAVVATTVLAGMARVSHIDPSSGRAVGSGRTLIDPWDDFSPGRWLWFLANVRALPDPVPAVGHQGSGIGISRSDDTRQPSAQGRRRALTPTDPTTWAWPDAGQATGCCLCCVRMWSHAHINMTIAWRTI